MSKRYTKYTDTPTLLGRAAQLRGLTKRTDLWAIEGATFAVGAGECVGIIGQNGSGKSTLLRMLAGVTAPTVGRIEVSGRVAPLISVGVGFHRELSGRENVYVNGTVLGRTSAEMERSFDEILEFSELGDFIDTPVKFYSSGMLIRLGFAVAILVQPDILIVDEVLAVGDMAFQLKCFDRMGQILESGTTILLVSHNLRAVQRLCPRTIVLDHGAVRYDGATSEGIGAYHEILGESRDIDQEVPFAEGFATEAATDVERFELLGPDGRPTRQVSAGAEITVELEVRFIRDVDPLVLGLNILAAEGPVVYATTTPWPEARRFAAGERARFVARLPVTLASGSYRLRMGLVTASNTLVTPSARPMLFYVQGRNLVRGFADLGASLETVMPPTLVASSGEDDLVNVRSESRE